jgi:hypothetical protein
MVTTIKASFKGQSKAVTPEFTIESDELTQEEIIERTKNGYEQMFNYATIKTMEMSK